MIRVEGLGKRYNKKVLFADIDYFFDPGSKVALVGRNGAGKTTFLNILSGIEEADHGTVLIPSGTKIGFLPQEPNAKPQANVLLECMAGNEEVWQLKQSLDEIIIRLETHSDDDTLSRFEKLSEQYRLQGGYELEAAASQILAGLGFLELDRNPLSLSGGWRMRLELARLFIKSPGFLVLDEPTNHLDLPSLIWVEKYLRAFKGALLFVSHDRELLDRLATKTIYLAGGMLEEFKGNYSYFLVEKDRRQAEKLANISELEKRKKELQLFIDRMGAKASKAAQAQSKQKLVDKLTQEIELIQLEKPTTKVAFQLPHPPTSDRIMLTVQDGAIGYSFDLVKNMTLQIERKQKIAIVGANGIGKTTLLKTLVGKIPSRGGVFKHGGQNKVAYFEQNLLDDLDLEATVLDNLMQKTPVGQAAGRTLLGNFGFNGDDVFKPVKVLSGGEKSRLGLACVLATEANFLLLDEPTNHLDMQSVEVLIKALKNYQGTMIFVSHNRQLVNEVATHIFAVTADGRSQLFEGQLEDYERLAPLTGFPNVFDRNFLLAGERTAEPAKVKINTKDNERDEKKKRSYASKNLVQIENKMEKLRSELEALDAELWTHTANHDFAKTVACQQKQNKLKDELGSLEESWLELNS